MKLNEKEQEREMKRMNIREIIEVSSTGLSKRWLVFAMFSQVSARVLEVTWFSCVIHLFFFTYRSRSLSMFEFLDTTGRTLALRIQSNRNVQVQLSATFVNDRNSIEKAYCETVCETDISVCGGRNVARQSFVSFFFYTYWCDFYISLCDYYNFSFIFYLLYGYKYIYM